jgi:hypothetical protein
MADSKSIRKPTGVCNPPAGYVTNEQVRAATGIGQFTLERLQRDKLVRWERQNCQSGRFTIYPENTIEIVRCIQSYKGFDNQYFALWLKGYDHIDIVPWIDRRLLTASKKLGHPTAAEISKVIAEATGKGRLRRKPQQSIFAKTRNLAVRQLLFKWSSAISVGAIPEASLYDRSTDTSSTLAKAIGGLPDPQLDIENMSLDRLRVLNKDASAAEREQVRQDCARLENVITIASSTGSVRTSEALTSLIGFWRKPDFRAFLVPFLIHMRRQPGYDYALERFLADMETEAHSRVSIDASIAEPAHGPPSETDPPSD